MKTTALRSATTAALFFGTVLASAGCTEAPEAMPPAPPLKDGGSVQLQSVTWNSKAVPVGKIAAAADLADDSVVFSDLGALVFTSGVLLATDANEKSWVSASVIPAGDLSGQWLVGMDGSGHVQRIKNRSVLEDVSDRYGLLGKKAREAVWLGTKSLSAFALDGEVAVADGQKVSRYSLNLSGLVGAGGRLAGLTTDGAVRVLDHSGSASDKPAIEYRLPDEVAVAVALDATAKLFIASEKRLYAESHGPGSELVLLLDLEASPDGSARGSTSTGSIHGLLSSGAAVYAAVGDSVYELVGDRLRRSEPGLIPVDAKLLPASSGQFYALSSAQGSLLRLGVELQGGPDELAWQRDVLPIFSRLCSLCHLPGGSASIDLSTYQTWASRRMLMEQRVLKGLPSPMPPAGAGMLTPEEQAALRAWLALSSGM